MVKELYVREWRLRLCLTQARAARRALIRQQTWSDVETGRAKRPRPLTLYSMAQALGIEVDDLYRKPKDAKP